MLARDWIVASQHIRPVYHQGQRENAAIKNLSCWHSIPVHVVQRGNNRQVCFANDEDIAAYANWLRVYAERYELEVHSWVFMTNHTHLLMTATSDTGIPQLMQTLGQMYVRYLALFERRYRSRLVQEDRYFLNCQRYIELNPTRAGMVRDPGDYRWSSYQAHAFGKLAKLWSRRPTYLALGDTPKSRQGSYRQQFNSELAENVVSKIRLCIHKGLVLSTDKFRQQVRELFG